jgi:hypothetical protein
MISNVIAHMHFLDFPIFSQFAEEIFVKRVEMLLDLLCVESVSRLMEGVLIDISAENGLGVVWFDVLSRAVFAVAACSYFVVEGAVDFVKFGA